MPDSDTGEASPRAHFPSGNGLAVDAVRVASEPGGLLRVHRHAAGAYGCVIDGSVMTDGRRRFVTTGLDSEAA